MQPIKRKNSPYWQYSFSIKSVRYRGTTNTTDKSLASVRIAKIYEKEFLKLTLGKKEDIMLRHALGKYWSEHAKDQRWSGTVKGFTKNISNSLGLDTYMHEITNSELSKLTSDLKKQKYAPASINRHLACFRRVYSLCKSSWGYHVSELNFGLQRQKEPDCRVRYLTATEARALIKQAAPHLKPIIQFALYTGARLSNILNLKWNDIDFASSKIIFKVKSTRPGGKNHVVDMASGCKALLKQLKASKANEYVFIYKGKRIKSVKKAFERACGQREDINGDKIEGLIQISNFRFHDLRHTCASWLVQAGEPIEIVKEILGHEDIKTTLKYAHHNNKRKKDALEGIKVPQIWHTNSKRLRIA